MTTLFQPSDPVGFLIVEEHVVQYAAKYLYKEGIAEKGKIAISGGKHKL